MFKIKTTGFDELLKKLENAPKKVVELVEGVFENTSKEFVSRAKRDAPKDTGNAGLTGQISYKREGDMRYNIVSASKYAGYLEFGTKRNFVVIPGFEKEASEIKGLGSSGTAEEALENITQWVQRKGFRYQRADGKDLTLEQTAWIVWHFININGIKPQPYFFKQVAIAENNLEKDLKQIAEEIFD